MARTRLFLLVLAIVAVTVGVWSGASSAAPTSQGCSFLNGGTADGRSSGVRLAVMEFVAGDVVRVTAEVDSEYPTEGGIYMTKQLYSRADESVLEDPVEVDRKVLPGDLTYTIPADATYLVGWGVDAGVARFRAVCTPAAPGETTTTTTTTTPDPGPDDDITTPTTDVGVIGDVDATATVPVADVMMTEAVAVPAVPTTATPSFTG